jgi:hypothetical protein
MPLPRDCLVVIALCAPSLAITALPVFTAPRPPGDDVEADADAKVLVNGAAAQVNAPSAQACEARPGEVPFAIIHDGGGRGLQVSDAGPNRANGVCAVREVSEGTEDDDGRGPTAGAPSATSRDGARFGAGANGAVISATNLVGQSIRHVLGARKGQMLVVAFDTDSEELTYRIAYPDGSGLLDEIGTFQPYRGQLWRSGDSVVDLINRSASRNAAVDSRFAID